MADSIDYHNYDGGGRKNKGEGQVLAVIIGIETMCLITGGLLIKSSCPFVNFPIKNTLDRPARPMTTLYLKIELKLTPDLTRCRHSSSIKGFLGSI